MTGKKIKVNFGCAYCYFYRSGYVYEENNRPTFTEGSLKAFHGVKVHIGLKHKGADNIPRLSL